MKCGLCQSETMNVYGSDGETILREKPIRNASDLWDHKHKEHQKELGAARHAAVDKRKEREQAENVASEHRKELRAAASKPAIMVRGRGWTGKQEPEWVLITTAELSLTAGRADQEFPIRYPEPEIFEVYNDLLTRIADLQEEAKDTLKRAWEAGLEISEGEIDAVHAAGEVEG